MVGCVRVVGVVQVVLITGRGGCHQKNQINLLFFLKAIVFLFWCGARVRGGVLILVVFWWVEFIDIQKRYKKFAYLGKG